MAMQAGAAALSGAGSSFHLPVRVSVPPFRQGFGGPHFGQGTVLFRLRAPLNCPGVSRRPIATVASAGSDTEKKFQSTVELDKLIDTLRATEFTKLSQVVAENILAFNTDFWLRLAARADLSTSVFEKRRFEELANEIMSIVQLIVQKTQEKMDSSSDILRSILSPMIEPSGEINWPPSNKDSFFKMRKEIRTREETGHLDEAFLSQVSAQMRQAREDGDKPGLVAMLQKVLQLYCSILLSKRSYAVKGNDIDSAEALLEKLISGDAENWNEDLRTGLRFGGGTVEIEELSRVAEKRVERTLMRTESGSYQQRLLVEYVREIQSRAEILTEAFKSTN